MKQRNNVILSLIRFSSSTSFGTKQSVLTEGADCNLWLLRDHDTNVLLVYTYASIDALFGKL